MLPGGLGHNALAATTYTLVFTLFIVEIVTGFAMLTFNWGGGWHTALGWVFALAQPQTIHLVHYMVMWLLLGSWCTTSRRPGKTGGWRWGRSHTRFHAATRHL